ncbi:hypothetical protein ACIQTW_10410 [Paenarthrobacter sp. NPDC090517]|uniref:hypothetical protein n=1 Tax=Paenarthrobacter sp. NPDC090517 TaxID=3364381 RepID=UPI0037F8A1A8
MNQQSRLPGRLGKTMPIPAGLVGVAAAGSAIAHVTAAAGTPAGVMAWWMAAMGAACLTCTAPMACSLIGRRFRLCARQAAPRAASHLLAMSAAMILIHLVLLLGPGGGHHGYTRRASVAGHQAAMLTLIGVELLCLLAASAALRIARTSTPQLNPHH